MEAQAMRLSTAYYVIAALAALAPVAIWAVTGWAQALLLFVMMSPAVLLTAMFGLFIGLVEDLP